jgi:hypothetical protein
MRKVLVPPLGNPLTSVRQSSDEIWDRNARLLERPAVIDNLTKLADGFEGESRDWYDHRRADNRRE